jgi:6-pyruvoyltetrahydropterin/6-carboxytetrahydropterin synthase
MFRLTREIRFAINGDDASADAPALNGFGGVPAMRGIGHYFALHVTLAGDLNPQSGYLRNIKEIDQDVRRKALPLMRASVIDSKCDGGALLLGRIFDAIKDAWPPCAVERLRLALSPTMSLDLLAKEIPMVRLNQKFEFCAAHRLNNPALSEERNRQLFGKCNNPNGHGHNYILKVSVAGRPGKDGVVIGSAEFEGIVRSSVLEPFDHKNLNIEVEEFATLNPTVENIARVIHGRLKPGLEKAGVKLTSVTVWESERTSCEYSD